MGVILRLLVWTTSHRKYLLHLIKQLLGYDWLVFTLVYLTQVAEVSIVEGVGEDKRDFVSVESLASLGDEGSCANCGFVIM